MPKEIYCCCLISPHCSKIPKKNAIFRGLISCFQIPTLFYHIFIHTWPYNVPFSIFRVLLSSRPVFCRAVELVKLLKSMRRWPTTPKSTFAKKYKIQRWSHPCNNNNGAKIRNFKYVCTYISSLLSDGVVFIALFAIGKKFPYTTSIII